MRQDRKEHPLARVQGVAPLLALPIACWVLGAWLHLGDIGKYYDDYHFGPVRDNAPDTLTWRFPFFFRPLMRTTLPALERLLWNHDALHHAMQIATHGLNALLLSLLLGVLGFSRLARTVGATIFLLHPALYELHFWVSAFPTTLAVLCMLLALNFAVRFCKRGGWWRLVCVAVAAFCVPCFNEQPAAIFGLLPILAVSMMWTPGAAPRRTLLLRGLTATFAAGVPCVVYILLQRATMPADWPGAVNRYADFSQALRRTEVISLRLLSYAATEWIGEGFLAGAWRAVGHAPVRACLLLCAVAASAWGFLRVARRETPNISSTTWRSRVLLCVGGWAAALLTVVPVALVQGYGVGPRMCLGIVFACAITAACVCERLLQRALLTGRSTLLRAASAFFVGVSGVMAVMLLGAQHTLRERWLADERLAVKLREAFPTLPPWACIVPFENRERTPAGPSRGFELLFGNALNSAWPCRGFVRRAFGRADIYASWAEPGGHTGHWGPSERGIEVFPPMDVWYKPQGPPQAPEWIFPWSLIAGVRIDELGNVRRVSEVLVREGGAWRVYRLPLGEGGVRWVWKP